MDLQKIKLKDSLMKLVKENKKNATTRLGIKNYKLGSAILINATDNNDRILIKIKKLELIQYHEISDELAKKENYQNKDELKKALQNFYGDIYDDSYLIIVSFEKENYKNEG